MENQRLVELMSHGEWADALLWKSVLSSAEATEDTQVLTWMHHVHSVQRGFDALWRDEEVSFCKVEDFAGVMDIIVWGREGHSRVRETVSGATPERLDRVLPIPWAKYFQSPSGRAAAPVSMGESVQQVAMHSVHHRAQVASRLRGLEVEPPLIDYIGWLWFDRPPADWPVAVASSQP